MGVFTSVSKRVISSIGQYAVIIAASCKLLPNIVHMQYYANEGCITCASLSSYKFYHTCSCDKGLTGASKTGRGVARNLFLGV